MTAAHSDKRILDKIVKHVDNGVDDPFTPLYDEYMMKRERPKYRKKRLKTFTYSVPSRSRPSGRLSPSSIGGCERKAVMVFTGTEGISRFDPETLTTFDDGNWRHLRWNYTILDMERVLGKDRFRVIAIEKSIRIPKLFISGHYDAIVAIFMNGQWVEYLLDFKGAHAAAYLAAITDPEVKEVYRKQIHTYMRGAGKKLGFLLYENKDRNNIQPVYVKSSKGEWREIKEWCQRVITYMETKRLPPRHPGCRAGTFLNEKCPFRQICFGDKSSGAIRKLIYKGFKGVKQAWQEGLEAEEAEETRQEGEVTVAIRESGGRSA